MMKIPDTKTEAIEMFGGKSQFCKAVGIKLQSLAFWSENLTKNAKDRVELALLKRNNERMAANQQRVEPVEKD